MSDILQTQLVNAAASHAGSEASVHLMEPSISMMILTWIAFLLMTWILYKVAWKPILAALEQRETNIRKDLAEAGQARKETAELKDQCNRLLITAEAEARRVVEEARSTAHESARLIETKARDEARVMVEGARRDIQAATERAREELRRQSAVLAIEMAGRIMGESMDTERNRAMVERLSKEI